MQGDGRNFQSLLKKDVRIPTHPLLRYPRVCLYWKHIQKDGSEFDAEVSLSRLETEGTNSLQAIVRDITERKQSEETLKIERQRFFSLLNGNEFKEGGIKLSNWKIR